jgi:type II secretory pathway pseudopilin PulG
MKARQPELCLFATRQGPASLRVSRPAAAFSLVELLITFVLLLLLVVMYHGFGSRVYQREQKRACQKNLQRIYVALEIYANEHDSAFPAVAGAQTSEEPLSVLVPRYTVDAGSFICPGTKRTPLPDGQSFAKRRISYAYFMGRRMTDAKGLLLTDQQINTLPKNEGDQIFSRTGKPPGNNHHKYGGNYLFLDGSLEMSSATAPFPITWPDGVVLLNPKP